MCEIEGEHIRICEFIVDQFEGVSVNVLNDDLVAVVFVHPTESPLSTCTISLINST